MREIKFRAWDGTRFLNKTFLTPDIIDKLNQIYNHFGDMPQRLKLEEECEEYIDSLIYSQNQKEEIADVFVLSAQLVLNNPDIQKNVEFKLNRTLQRIADGYYKTV